MAQGLIYTGIAIEEVKRILLKQVYKKKIDSFGECYYQGKINFYPMIDKEGTKIVFEDLTFWKERGCHNGMNDMSKEGKRLLENLINQLSNIKITDHLGKEFEIKNDSLGRKI